MSHLEPTPAKHKTCRRYNDPGDAHTLTFSCFQQRPFLSSERTCMWLIDALDSARRRHGFELWAYVIMPDHVHLLIWPRGDNYSISRILAAIKLPVTRRALAYVRKHQPESLHSMRDAQPNGMVAHRFWQRGGGYDRNIVKPAVLHSTIEYIHANPVRRGLVTSPDEWPWSSASFYAGGTLSPLTPDADSVPPRDA
jgi:putative transposase